MRQGAFSYYKITYSDGIEFYIDNKGTEVWVNWPDPLSFDEVLSYLAGRFSGLPFA